LRGSASTACSAGTTALTASPPESADCAREAVCPRCGRGLGAAGQRAGG
jgi:hypothetical protein